jgi:hypothetical protein
MIKDRSTGYIGSKFVGVPAATKTPAPSPVLDQLKQRSGGNTGVLTPQVQPSRAIEGFDAQKFADPTLGTTHKYVGGRIIAGGGSVDDVLADPKFAGWSKVSEDKILGAGGTTYDVRRDMDGADAAQWTAVAGPGWDKNGIPGVNSLGVNSSMKSDGIKGNYAAANAAASDAAGAAGTSRFGYAGTPGGGAGVNSSMKNDGIKGNYAAAQAADAARAAGQSGGGGGLGTAGVAGAAGGGFMDQIRARLMAQMDQAGQPVTAQDPTIAAAMGGARLESERGLEQSRKEQAERMYAEGSLNSNALGQGLQASRERAAGGLASLQGDLMGREMTARRTQMATLLQQALQSGDNESARALTLKLNEMDNAIRRQQLSQQGSQWDDQYGLNVQDAQYQRDRDAARAKAGLNF